MPASRMILYLASTILQSNNILTSEGLRQRKWVTYLAVYVAIGFVGNELSLFLICRPLSNYWAVPTPYGQSKR